ncbi:hypothetical protein PTSG_10068 [Salpingoeca rosetta]|uniref:Ubiquitin-like domain-containing protein n=1 Tax=Salpingoeca rosetta (strain ATCC 50818 / BSB-021) TaxID=946362 RepID=F2UPE3_SALR5|nr:uncharacterized protein PTSG_10068 [Salpingoeca rosetta]EGD79498.1 hypothetical protein PTSG_10068 [Salpingoeca rosetta]|eukprot:XP_004988979.1 hypothetical protein PTSG_10068 [Salpingoeca rosetta]
MAMLAVTVTHGADKYKLSVPPSTRLRQLQDNIEEVSRVPVKAQKLLLKGRVLKDYDAELRSLTKKSKLKLMLMGEKESPEIEQCKKKLAEVHESIQKHAKEMQTHEETWKQISEGFLAKELVPEAVKKLKKQVLGVNEMNVRLLEQMDSLPIHKDMTKLRTTRKLHIAEIETDTQ